MIKIEHVVTPSPEQWIFAIEGMRNPLNSWKLSDSYTTHIENEETLNTALFDIFIGDKDLKLMLGLDDAGPEHRKFMRMLPVCVRLTAPLYWWKEFDTYKVGTVRNSCSTMHKIAAKEFDISDFSCEHLNQTSLNNLTVQIDALNANRVTYSQNKDRESWWQLIQLLPSAYNQTANIFLNYETLATIYRQRRYHKLDEWRIFCSWIETLPYSELITLPYKEED